MLISFLFLDEGICCGYSLEAPRRGASNEYPQHMPSSRNKKNIMWIHPLICSYELCSDWCPSRINTGTTFCIIIYMCINNIKRENRFKHRRLFVDDTSVYTVDDPLVATELLNLDPDKIPKWANEWLVKFNPYKPKIFWSHLKLIVSFILFFRSTNIWNWVP